MKIFTKTTQPEFRKPPEYIRWFQYTEQPYISTSHNLAEGSLNTHIPVNKYEKFRCILYNTAGSFNLDAAALSKLAEFKIRYTKYDVVPVKRRIHHDIF